MGMTRTPSKTFTDLIVWPKAHAMVLSTYRLTEGFPKSEAYGLTSQLRRAAVSVPANIAEGFKKRSVAEKGRFLAIVQASLEECRYYLILAKDLGYASTDSLNSQVEEVSRLLTAYVRAIIAKSV